MVAGLAHKKHFLKKQCIVKNKDCVNIKTTRTCLPNAVYLSNQILHVGVNNAAWIIQKLILPQIMSYNKHDQ